MAEEDEAMKIGPWVRVARKRKAFSSWELEAVEIRGRRGCKSQVETVMPA